MQCCNYDHARCEGSTVVCDAIGATVLYKASALRNLVVNLPFCKLEKKATCFVMPTQPSVSFSRRVSQVTMGLLDHRVSLDVWDFQGRM